MLIKVFKFGFVILVQDVGCEGYYYLGILLFGVFDQYVLCVVNLLVGNVLIVVVLECVLLGLQLEFQCDVLVVVCGVCMMFCLEGVEMLLDIFFWVCVGQVLGFDFICVGVCGYFVIDGGIVVFEVLGSCLIYGLGMIGGLQG